MEGLVKRYFKFIWWFVKFGGEVAPGVFEFQRGIAYIVYGQVALQQQLAQELTIDFSKNTDDGKVIVLKMVMSKKVFLIE